MSEDDKKEEDDKNEDNNEEGHISTGTRRSGYARVIEEKENEQNEEKINAD